MAVRLPNLLCKWGGRVPRAFERQYLVALPLPSVRTIMLLPALPKQGVGMGSLPKQVRGGSVPDVVERGWDGATITARNTCNYGTFALGCAVGIRTDYFNRRHLHHP